MQPIAADHQLLETLFGRVYPPVVMPETVHFNNVQFQCFHIQSNVPPRHRINTQHEGNF